MATRDLSAAPGSRIRSNRLRGLRRAITVAAALRHSSLGSFATDLRVLDLSSSNGALGHDVARRLGAASVYVDTPASGPDQGASAEDTLHGPLPFADATFDIVIADHVLERAKEPKALLEEIRRLLKPKGVCYLAVANEHPRGGQRFGASFPSRGALYRSLAAAHFEAQDITLEIARNPARYGFGGMAARLRAFVSRVAGSHVFPDMPERVLVLRPASEGRVISATSSSSFVGRVFSAALGVLSGGLIVGGRVERSLRSGQSGVHRALAELTAILESRMLYLPLFVVAAAPAIWLGVQSQGVFNAPDETAAYVAAQEFVRNGRFYIQDELTELDPFAPTAPRGFVQYKDRAIPTYSLGHLAFRGVAHLGFGAGAPVVLGLLSGLTFVVLTMLIRRLRPGAPPFLGFAFLGITPLWYWSSRVYFDIGLTMLFVLVGLLCCVVAVQRASLRWFLASSCALGLAALVRQPEATFLLLLGLALTLWFLQRHATWGLRNVLAIGGVYALGQVLTFLVPTALLNWATNGSPFVFGYRVFYSFYWPNLVETPSANPVVRALGFVRGLFFPQPIALGVVWHGLVNQVALLVPVLAALGIAGWRMAWRPLRQQLGWPGITLVAVALVYVVLSRANPGTFLALAEGPDIRASLVRYWMPLYIALGLGTAYALTLVARPVAVAVIAALVVTATYQVWVDGPESMRNLQASVEANSRHYAEVLTVYTEPDALVFAGARSDKWVAPVRRTAGLWAGTDVQVPSEQLMQGIGDAARRMSQLGTPVYFILGPQEDSESLAAYLAIYHYGLVYLTSIQPGADLWKLAVLSRPLEVEPIGEGLYRTGPFDVGSEFAVVIEHDGSAHNLITNPSFEQDLRGWSGPDVGARVRQSTDMPQFGSAALRMELSGQETDFVRRSYSVPAASLEDRIWSVRGWVFAESLEGAVAELRVFVQDQAGGNIERYSVKLSQGAEAFQPLSIEGRPLPEASARLTVQLAFVPEVSGGRGVVYWDGLEVVSSAKLPAEYCDGDHNGCRWADVPHQSESLRGPIEGFSLVREDGQDPIAVDAPLLTGDRILFVDREAFLERADGTRQPLGAIESKSYRLVLSAPAMPVVSLSPLP